MQRSTSACSVKAPQVMHHSASMTSMRRSTSATSVQLAVDACPSCGNIYAMDAIFCRKCGAKRQQAYPTWAVSAAGTRQSSVSRLPSGAQPSFPVRSVTPSSMIRSPTVLQMGTTLPVATPVLPGTATPAAPWAHTVQEPLTTFTYGKCNGSYAISIGSSHSLPASASPATPGASMAAPAWKGLPPPALGRQSSIQQLASSSTSSLVAPGAGHQGTALRSRLEHTKQELLEAVGALARVEAQLATALTQQPLRKNEDSQAPLPNTDAAPATVPTTVRSQSCRGTPRETITAFTPRLTVTSGPRTQSYGGMPCDCAVSYSPRLTVPPPAAALLAAPLSARGGLMPSSSAPSLVPTVSCTLPLSARTYGRPVARLPSSCTLGHTTIKGRPSLTTVQQVHAEPVTKQLNQPITSCQARDSYPTAPIKRGQDKVDSLGVELDARYPVALLVNDIVSEVLEKPPETLGAPNLRPSELKQRLVTLILEAIAGRRDDGNQSQRKPSRVPAGERAKLTVAFHTNEAWACLARAVRRQCATSRMDRGITERLVGALRGDLGLSGQDGTLERAAAEDFWANWVPQEEVRYLEGDEVPALLSSWSPRHQEEVQPQTEHEQPEDEAKVANEAADSENPERVPEHRLPNSRVMMAEAQAPSPAYFCEPVTASTSSRPFWNQMAVPSSQFPGPCRGVDASPVPEFPGAPQEMAMLPETPLHDAPDFERMLELPGVQQRRPEEDVQDEMEEEGEDERVGAVFNGRAHQYSTDRSSSRGLAVIPRYAARGSRTSLTGSTAISLQNVPARIDTGLGRSSQKRPTSNARVDGSSRSLSSPRTASPPRRFSKLVLPPGPTGKLSSPRQFSPMSTGSGHEVVNLESEGQRDFQQAPTSARRRSSLLVGDLLARTASYSHVEQELASTSSILDHRGVGHAGGSVAPRRKH